MEKDWIKKNYPSTRMSCPHMEYTSRGGALLLEHLPGRGKYPEGVLFIIFRNGEAFFYPLEQFDDGHYDAHPNRATLISSDSSTFTRSAGMVTFLPFFPFKQAIFRYSVFHNVKNKIINRKNNSNKRSDNKNNAIHNIPLQENSTSN